MNKSNLMRTLIVGKTNAVCVDFVIVSATALVNPPHATSGKLVSSSAKKVQMDGQAR